MNYELVDLLLAYLNKILQKYQNAHKLWNKNY